MTVAPDKPTAERILDIAERLVQTRGFTNFSYADIAGELGITKASLHYRMCMCGVLAGEYETLPDPMRAAVIRFFDDNQAWLVHVLREGVHDGTLAFSGSTEDVAQTILVTLEGAMLVARPYGDLGRFTATSQQLIRGLTGGASA